MANLATVLIPKPAFVTLAVKANEMLSGVSATPPRPSSGQLWPRGSGAPR